MHYIILLCSIVTEVKPYVVNDRLFPEPVQKSLFADYDYNEPGPSQVPEREPTYDEPRFVRYCIVTKLSPHLYEQTIIVINDYTVLVYSLWTICEEKPSTLNGFFMLWPTMLFETSVSRIVKYVHTVSVCTFVCWCTFVFKVSQ